MNEPSWSEEAKSKGWDVAILNAKTHTSVYLDLYQGHTIISLRVRHTEEGEALRMAEEYGRMILGS